MEAGVPTREREPAMFEEAYPPALFEGANAQEIVAIDNENTRPKPSLNDTCVVYNVDFSDNGFVWSNKSKLRDRQSKKSALQLVGSAADDVTGDYEESDIADELKKLGLPVAFGCEASSGRRTREEVVLDLAMTDSGPTATLFNSMSDTAEPRVRWQQAFDLNTGLLYYYSEAEQRSQWEEPSEPYNLVPEEQIGTIIPSSSWEQYLEKRSIQDEPTRKLQMTGILPRIGSLEANTHIRFPGSDEEDHECMDGADTHEGQPDALKRQQELSLNVMASGGTSESPPHQRLITKKKKRRRKTKKSVPLTNGGHNDDPNIDSEMVSSRPPLPSNLRKYWLQRYRLFSRYDEGILIDLDGWFSVTPEKIAWHHAKRLVAGAGGGTCIALDAFAGVGGNTIQLACAGCHVIAVEINPYRAACICHNARVYGVTDRVEVICADFMRIAAGLRADVALLSPPWGGPQYSKEGEFDVEMMGGHPEFGLTRLLHLIFHDVGCGAAVAWLPRNAAMTQLAAAAEVVPEALLTKGRTKCEVERAVVNGRLKAVSVYYGTVVRSAKKA